MFIRPVAGMTCIEQFYETNSHTYTHTTTHNLQLNETNKTHKYIRDTKSHTHLEKRDGTLKRLSLSLVHQNLCAQCLYNNHTKWISYVLCFNYCVLCLGRMSKIFNFLCARFNMHIVHYLNNTLGKLKPNHRHTHKKTHTQTQKSFHRS